MIPDVFLISPVRNARQEAREKIKAYVESIEKTGKKVHWPERDTDQNDPVGIRICCDNFTKMLQAAEVHCWYDAASKGSLFDAGGLFMLLVLRSPKKFVLVNKEEVEAAAIPGTKSFENVLLALDRGEEVSVVTLEKK